MLTKLNYTYDRIKSYHIFLYHILYHYQDFQEWSFLEGCMGK